MMALGIGSSFLVHELSHVLYAEMNGGGHFDSSEFVAIMEDYHNQSYGVQQNFHRSGFVGQLLVGGILTAIPATRHSDFALGFNSATAINTAVYTISGGFAGDDVSDIKRLDHGEAEGIAYTVAASALSIYNLKGER